MWRAILVALVLALAAEAAGQPGPTLIWRAPSGCPDDRAAREVWRGADRALRASVTISVEGGRARAEVEIRGPGGPVRRRFEAGGCRAVADAALVVLALAAGYAPPAVPPVTPPPPPTTTGARPRPAPLDGHAAVALGARLERGRMPGLSPGAIARGAIGLGRARLEVSVAGHRSAEVTEDDRGARFRLWTVGAALCGRVIAPLWACLGGEWSEMRASTFGVREPASPRAGWLAGTGAIAAHVPLVAALELELRAGAHVARRVRYRFDGASVLHRTRQLGTAVEIALGWRF